MTTVKKYLKDMSQIIFASLFYVLICIFELEIINGYEGNYSNGSKPISCNFSTNILSKFCLNGGRCIIEDKTYKCKCRSNFIGKFCEINTDICKKILPDGKIPCKENGFICQPVFHGYICRKKSSNNLYEDAVFKKVIDSCPQGWYKIESNNGYRCQYSIEQNFLKSFPRKTIIAKKQTSCKDVLCNFGAICVKNKCKCLRHFEGTNCENPINYCKKDSCNYKTKCIPRLGGFTCHCPPTYTGINCQTRKLKNIYNMKYPTFFYQPVQHVKCEHYFLFFAKEIGTLPKIEVSFGDGVITNFSNQIYHLKVTVGLLLKYFYPPYKWNSHEIYAYFFNHSYEETGSYTIRVKAWNRYFKIFDTEYQVRVLDSEYCMLNVELRNAAKEKSEAISYYRKDRVTLFSSVHTNCPGIKILYFWNMHKVKEYDDYLNKSNTYVFQNNYIKFNNPYLMIQPFSLDYGKYVAVLKVQLLLRPNPLKEIVFTWFEVKHIPIIAHIDGGRLLWANTNTTFYIDASKSFDPNYKKTNQPQFEYKWTCTLYNTNDSCTDEISNQNQSVLLLSPYEFDINIYVFKVNVTSFVLYQTKSYSSTATQTIVMKDEPTILSVISCEHNCIGYTANPNYVIALLGTCISCSFGMSNRITWTVYSFPDDNSKTGTRLNHTNFSKNYSYMIMYENQLDKGSKYRIVFTGKEEINSFSNDKAKEIYKVDYSLPEVTLFTYQEPSAGICNVDPLEGYGMLTVFTVSCHGFKSGENILNIENHLQYEVIQFYDSNNRLESGVFSGYSVTGVIKGITLAPGVVTADYLTIVFINVINNEGLYTNFVVNITVFPPIFYLKEPNKLIYRLNFLGDDAESPLGILHSERNYIELTQQIISASQTILNILNGDKYILQEHIEMLNLDKIKTVFTTYLYGMDIVSIKSLKHVATALSKIFALPGTNYLFQEHTFLGLKIFKKFIKELKDAFYRYEEKITKEDMDDIGILFVNIVSHIFKVFDEPKKAEDFDYSFHVSNSQSKYITKKAIANLLVDFMDIYLFYKALYERPTLITHDDVAIMIIKTSAEVLSRKPLLLIKKITLNFGYDKFSFDKNMQWNVKILIYDDDPEWSDGSETKYPLIFLNITDPVDQKNIDCMVSYKLYPQKNLNIKYVTGILPIKLFWEINEEDIQVHRIQLSKGAKLLINFSPLEENNKLIVVVKKHFRPRMYDFWNEGITIPQKVPNDKALSIFVDDENDDKITYYYIGVLPHTKTLKFLMRNVEEPVLLDMFEYDDDIKTQGELLKRKMIKSEKRNQDVYETKQTERTVQYFQNSRIDNGNNTLPYSFSVYSVECVIWNQSSNLWKKSCQVLSTTTFSHVDCRCFNTGPVTVRFKSIPTVPQKMIRNSFVIYYNDNPLILFLAILFLILFIGLFSWAIHEDSIDIHKRKVTFLIDNYPTFEHCYLVIVYTGHKLCSGTTSNVVITLEGTLATSLPHVLHDSQRKVLRYGHRDWFLLKTLRPLGDIYCIHMWSDFTGAFPQWYCEKVIVHDLQQHQIWFFMVQKWFHPLHGDGSMAYTIYQSTDFATNFYFVKDSLKTEFDAGMHGWFGIFSKQPYNNFTRKQRVVVAYMHLSVMMLILILLHGRPSIHNPVDQISKTGLYVWSTDDVIKGFVAALIAFPCEVFFVWLFRCTKPAPQWTEIRGDSTVSTFNMASSLSVKSPLVFAMSSSTISKLHISPSRQKRDVTFALNYYDEGAKSKLKSFHSLEELRKAIGKSKVVSLKKPISINETYILRSENETSISESILDEDFIYGDEIVEDNFCFPPFILYVGWVILILISILCTYLTILYGISYGWISSLHYLVSLFFTLLLSMFVLEMLKWFLAAWYTYLINKKHFTVEDRTDLVKRLVDEYQIPPNLHYIIAQKINILRQFYKYKPIWPGRLHKLIRNKYMETKLRAILIDLIIMILFLVILISIMRVLYDSYAYLHVKNIDEVVTGIKTKEQIKFTLSEVKDEEDLVFYLNTTLIPNVHHYYISPNSFDVEPVIDENNYLVGVIALAQLRISKANCLKKKKNITMWYTYCSKVFDQKNYSEGWKSYDPSVTQDNPWTFTPMKQLNFSHHLLHQNLSYYPKGAYVALLGRNKEDSLNILKDLAENGWFDEFTLVVYIYMNFYNINLKYLSVVTVMVERIEEGRMQVYKNIEAVKLRSKEDLDEILILVMFSVLICQLLFFIFWKSDRILNRGYFRNVWHLLDVSIGILGILVVIFFVQRVQNLNFYHDILLKINLNKHVCFYKMCIWNKALVGIVAGILFLVILKFWHLLYIYYSIILMTTVLKKAALELFHLFIVLIILLIFFSFLAYKLFLQNSYYFRNFCNSFYNVLHFTRRHFRNSNFYTSYSCIRLFYFFVLFIVVFFILRWFFAVVLLQKYVDLKRRLNRDTLDIQNLSSYGFFTSATDLTKDKKFKNVMKQKIINPKLRGMGYLVVCNQDNFITRGERDKSRNLAMESLTLDVLQQRHLGMWYKPPDYFSDRQRNERAKEIARIAILYDSFDKKFQYLEAKLDSIIRQIRYNKTTPQKKY